MLCSAACGPGSGKETGETALLQEVLDQFAPGDILLADTRRTLTGPAELRDPDSQPSRRISAGLCPGAAQS